MTISTNFKKMSEDDLVNAAHGSTDKVISALAAAELARRNTASHRLYSFLVPNIFAVVSLCLSIYTIFYKK